MKHSGTDVFASWASGPPVAVDKPGTKTAARPRLQIYWYHPDHLGTGTLITDLEGRPHQFFLNLPYGETFIEQKHAGYDNPYKFNGKELDQETGLYYYGARYYDPKISLWLSVDPLAEKYPGVSPYAYTYDNPVRFMDPTGMEGEISDDKIFVGKDGRVVDIIRDDKPNEFYDADTGEKLEFNDPDGIDGDMMLDAHFEIGDQIYIPISNEKLDKAIEDAGIIEERKLANYLPNEMGLAALIISYAEAASKSYGNFDFAENYLVHFIESPSINFDSNRRNGRTFYHSESGYFRFGNSNTLYNLYDAGNYMWGRAMRMSGFSYFETKYGSQMNALIFTQSLDSDADQRAIQNGYYGL